MNFAQTFFNDLIYFLLFFCAFYLTVATCKFFIALISAKISSLHKKPVPKKRKPRRPAAVRSIEINPDEVDRIYVKKIS